MSQSALTISRRQALKLLFASGAVIYLQPFTPRKGWAVEPLNLVKISPVDRTLPDVADPKFYGDNPDPQHQILWNKPGFVATPGNLPTPSEQADVVIVGGGISGLFSAYLLRKYNPIVLEQDPRFGGNSKGQSWRGIDYSIGAAYFIEPEADSDIANLCTELGIDQIWKIKEEEGPVELKKTLLKDFWSGEVAGSDEKAKAQFQKLHKYFNDVNEGETITYPDIPITDPEIESYIYDLDKVSFKKHMETIAGEKLHPLLETTFEHYCWSSMGGSSAEISAASALNFFAAEFGNLAVCPGGNSGAAEKVLEKLVAELPADRLRDSCLVYDVRLNGDGVKVTYKNGAGSVISIQAKTVIMACPKFVVAKILDGIEPTRLAAIQKLKYRAYMVANACIKAPIKEPFYDMYLLGDGRVRTDAVKDSAIEQRATDVILANYAKGAGGENTVLTAYRAFPYEGMRAELLAPTAYKYYRESFEQQFKLQIMPLLGLNKEDLVDLRVSRWGHPIPLASVGLIADGTVKELTKPFGGKVFFVEQDNWALPAFETSVTEAITWCAEVEKLIAPPAPTEEQAPAEQAPIAAPTEVSAQSTEETSSNTNVSSSM